MSWVGMLNSYADGNPPEFQFRQKICVCSCKYVTCTNTSSKVTDVVILQGGRQIIAAEILSILKLDINSKPMTLPCF
jgi:hypothetical protein